MYFCMLFGLSLKKKAIKILMDIIIALYQRKKLNTDSLVASYLMNQALRRVPTASEPKIANTQIEFAKNT